MKKIFLFIIILNCVMISKTFATNGINVMINGKTVQYNDNSGYPYVDENNRTMVPLRATMEMTGAAVGYDSTNPTAIVITEHNRIEVPIGTDYIYNNNKLIQNDTISVINNGRTYLPIRIVLEEVGYTVEWDGKTKTVNAYNYDYNSNEFIEYNTSDPSTLIHNIANGNVVYINGKYYATPEYWKNAHTPEIHYLNDDLNISRYPEEDWSTMNEAFKEFLNNLPTETLKTNDDMNSPESSYIKHEIEEVLNIEYKDLKIDIDKNYDYAYVKLKVSFTNKSNKTIAGTLTITPQTQKNEWSNIFKYEYEIEKLEPNKTITEEQTVILWSTQITDAENVISYLVNGSLHEYGEPFKIVAIS